MVLKTYLVVLIAPGVVLAHSHDEIQNGDKGANGIRITLEHDVAETDIVISRNMAGCYPTERRLDDRLVGNHHGV
jgi:hypothetical protein